MLPLRPSKLINIEHNTSSPSQSSNQNASYAAERIKMKTLEKIRRKKSTLRKFSRNTERRLEKNKINTENDKVRKVEILQRDAVKSLLRFADPRVCRKVGTMKRILRQYRSLRSLYEKE